MSPKILKQYNIVWIGGFKEVLSQTLFYVAIINFILIAITAYNTTLRVFILEWIPDFKLWMFFGILITSVLLGMILEYKFITPSLFSFRSKQMFEHESKVMDKIISIEDLLKGKVKKPNATVAISGGFDILHSGHTRHIKEALKLGHLLVILTRDDQLITKKGFYVMSYEERKEVVEAVLNGQGEVVENIDMAITSVESIRHYKPDIYAKGGDTWDGDNLPEAKVCEELGIKVVFGVGGFDKIQSSSELARGEGHNA